MNKSFILKHRAIAKTITWRITADLLTLIVISLLTGNIVNGFFVVGVQIFTKTFWFWAHEKVWGLSEKPPKGSQLRSVIKTVTWRVLATTDTLIIVLFITREPLWASSAALIDTFLKTLAYYIHERVWEYFFGEKIMLDLHTHTCHSDGELSVDELLALSIEKKCKYISICDHDNVDHIDSLKSTPSKPGYISGVEISAEYSGTLHILGYGFDPGNKELRTVLKGLQDARRQRNEAMLKNMADQGFYITMEELEEEAKGEIVGRPHFANLMVQKGYSASYQEAFDKYLAKGQPFYMDKQRLAPEEAIGLIRRAGGIPVMAHPYQTKLEGEELDHLVAELRALGLMGIEAYYFMHSKEQTRHYLELAKKHDLLVTAGSDFHGKNKAHIPLGMRVKHIDLIPFLEAVRK
jgi:3',5'-nucleoside bisphosphate phosphatase